MKTFMDFSQPFRIGYSVNIIYTVFVVYLCFGLSVSDRNVTGTNAKNESIDTPVPFISTNFASLKNTTFKIISQNLKHKYQKLHSLKTTTATTTTTRKTTTTTEASTTTSSTKPPPPPPRITSYAGNVTSGSIEHIPDQIASGSEHDFVNVAAPHSVVAPPQDFVVPRHDTASDRSSHARSGDSFLASPGVNFPQNFEKFGVQDSLIYGNNAGTGGGIVHGGSGVDGASFSTGYAVTPQPSYSFPTTFQNSGRFSTIAGGNSHHIHNTPPQPTSGGAYQLHGAIQSGGLHEINPFTSSHSNVKSYSPYSPSSQSVPGPVHVPSQNFRSINSQPSHTPLSSPSSGFQPATSHANSWQPTKPLTSGPVYSGGNVERRNDPLKQIITHRARQLQLTEQSQVSEDRSFRPSPQVDAQGESSESFLGSFKTGDLPNVVDSPQQQSSDGSPASSGPSASSSLSFEGLESNPNVNDHPNGPEPFNGLQIEGDHSEEGQTSSHPQNHLPEPQKLTGERHGFHEIQPESHPQPQSSGIDHNEQHFNNLLNLNHHGSHALDHHGSPNSQAPHHQFNQNGPTATSSMAHSNGGFNDLSSVQGNSISPLSNSEPFQGANLNDQHGHHFSAPQNLHGFQGISPDHQQFTSTPNEIHEKPPPLFHSAPPSHNHHNNNVPPHLQFNGQHSPQIQHQEPHFHQFHGQHAPQIQHQQPHLHQFHGQHNPQTQHQQHHPEHRDPYPNHGQLQMITPELGGSSAINHAPQQPINGNWNIPPQQQQRHLSDGPQTGLHAPSFPQFNSENADTQNFGIQPEQNTPNFGELSREGDNGPQLSHQTQGKVEQGFGGISGEGEHEHLQSPNSQGHGQGPQGFGGISGESEQGPGFPGHLDQSAPQHSQGQGSPGFGAFSGEGHLSPPSSQNAQGQAQDFKGFSGEGEDGPSAPPPNSIGQGPSGFVGISGEENHGLQQTHHTQGQGTLAFGGFSGEGNGAPQEHFPINNQPSVFDGFSDQHQNQQPQHHPNPQHEQQSNGFSGFGQFPGQNSDTSLKPGVEHGPQQSFQEGFGEFKPFPLPQQHPGFNGPLQNDGPIQMVNQDTETSASNENSVEQIAPQFGAEGFNNLQEHHHQNLPFQGHHLIQPQQHHNGPEGTPNHAFVPHQQINSGFGGPGSAQFDQGNGGGPGPVQFNQGNGGGPGPVQFNQGNGGGPGPVQFNQGNGDGPGPVQFNQGNGDGPGPVQFNQGNGDGPGPVQFNQGNAGGIGPVQSSPLGPNGGSLGPLGGPGGPNGAEFGTGGSPNGPLGGGSIGPIGIGGGPDGGQHNDHAPIEHDDNGHHHFHPTPFGEHNAHKPSLLGIGSKKPSLFNIPGLLKVVKYNDDKDHLAVNHKLKLPVDKGIKTVLDLAHKILSFYAKFAIPKDHYVRVLSFVGVYLLFAWLYKDNEHLLQPKCESWGWGGPEEFTFHAAPRFVPAIPVDQHMQREFLDLFRGVENCLDKKKKDEKKKKDKDSSSSEEDKKKHSSEEDGKKKKKKKHRSSSEEDDEDRSMEDNYSVEIGFINDMCPKGQFFYSMSPYHIEAWSSLSRLFVAQKTPADVLHLAKSLLYNHSVNPKVWYLGLMAAANERPDMTGFTLAHPIDAMPDMFIPGDRIAEEMYRYRGLIRPKRSLTSISNTTSVVVRKSKNVILAKNGTLVLETGFHPSLNETTQGKPVLMERKGEDEDNEEDDDEIDEEDDDDDGDNRVQEKKKKYYGFGYATADGHGYNRVKQQGNQAYGNGIHYNTDERKKGKRKKGKGKKKDKDKKKCIIVDGSVGLDNGIENKLWYWREDMMVSQHHWYWHQIYPVNATIHGDRRAELFFYMHRSMLARYNAERLSNGFARTQAIGLFTGYIIEESYNAHLKDFNSGQWWTPRPPQVPLTDINHIHDPDFARDIIINDVAGLYDRFVTAIKLGKLWTADGSFLPIRFHEGIQPLANTVEATNISVNPLYYDAFGLHNLGHLMLGLATDPDYSKQLPTGVMSETGTAMRDPTFYTFHSLLDNLFEKFKQTLPPYKPFGGVWPLQWHGVDIVNVQLVSHAGDGHNQLKTFYIKHKFQLEPGVDRSIEKGIEKAEVCAVHLDHAPFQFQITIDRKKCAKSKSNQGTVRIFMAPRYNEEGERLPFVEQRRLMFQLDAFQAELKVGRNIITRNSRDNSLTHPWSRSLREYERGPDPSGAADYCGCGWPHHLFIPKGNSKGMEFDLFVMVTNFDEDFVADHPKDLEFPETCNSPYIFCGRPRRRYPDARPMGYPFDRPPYPVPAKHCGNGLTFNDLLCKITGKFVTRPPATLEEYVSGATNMAMTVFEIKHIPKVVGKHYG